MAAASSSSESQGPQLSNAQHWQYIVQLCDEVGRRLPQKVAEVVHAIRTAMPDYRVVDEAEHIACVLQQAQGLLASIAQRRGPGPDEVGMARILGSRRAAQGLALENVVGAYHLGAKQMWGLLLERARGEDADRPAQLLAVVELLWLWIEAVTSAAADGHSAAIQTEQAQRLDAGHRLLEALYTGQPHRETTLLLARSLNFDPSGRFGAACVLAEPDPEDRLERLRRACRGLRATGHAQTRGATIILIVQGASPTEALQAADLETTPGGVGLTRVGLNGLALSVRDAEKAMALAVHRKNGVVDFAAEWFASILFTEHVELAPVLSQPRGPLPGHLADAVKAYAAEGFSIAAAGEALHVHPNTVKYRLERWRELTGWDPRTLDGLLKSVCSLALAPWEVAASRQPPL